MDQARWMIVLSVVFCMSLTLGLLKFFSGTAPVEIVQEEQTIGSNAELPAALVIEKGTAEPQQLREIRFPEPPAHIFAVAGQAENNRESEAFANEGKILP